MIVLVRVDDRLLHGQVLCSWVPFMKVDTVVIASDEAPQALKEAFESVCRLEGVTVVAETVEEAAAEDLEGVRAMVVVSSLKDAMRLYRMGLGFDSINIGNVHHRGAAVSPSVILDEEDKETIEEFLRYGVAIDIRDIPTRPSAAYKK